MIPPYPAETANKTERKVFSVIEKAANSENWYCLHSVGLARHHRKRYGEADFVLICPEGVLCLETKGGHVRRSKGVWTIGWPGSSYNSNEGPFKQAQGTIHPLIDEISSRLGNGFKRKVPVGWGVIFPDIAFDMKDPEWDLEVVCDTRHLDQFADYVSRLSEHLRNREETLGRKYPDRISSKEIEDLVACFRRDFDLVPRVSDLIQQGNTELAELSAQQYTVLRYALEPGNPRTLCPGQAGTGKTMLALEAARRLANEGQRVLLVCFNKLLGKTLEHETQAFANLVTATSLHSYMHSVITDAGLAQKLLEMRSGETDSAKVYNEIYTEVFEEAVDSLMDDDRFELFDALIVDEGQDLLFSPLFDAAALTLSGGIQRGRWLVFYDPGLQSELYGRLDENVLGTLRQTGAMTLSLFENFRNPEHFVDEMCVLTGTEKPICKRNLPAKVEYFSYETEEEQAQRLRAVLVELIRDEVPASSITILSGRTADKSCVFRFPPDVGKKILELSSEKPGPVEGEPITACSVAGYKGMENDVIILSDLPVPDPEQAWDSSVIYVGMTRARAKLIALVNEEFLESRFSSENQIEVTSDD